MHTKRECFQSWAMRSFVGNARDRGIGIHNDVHAARAIEHDLTAAVARDGNEAIGSMGNDTPLAALPDADSIPALYLVEEESRDIYRLVCRVVERQPRLYLQRVGRSRPTDTE